MAQRSPPPLLELWLKDAWYQGPAGLSQGKRGRGPPQGLGRQRHWRLLVTAIKKGVNLRWVKPSFPHLTPLENYSVDLNSGET